MDYSEIKDLATAHGCRVTDLIALAPRNDPFYVGTPAQQQQARWFADLWEEYGYGHGVHIRRVHYQIISQETPVRQVNGMPYENTERCWEVLSEASKAARYLGYVDAAAFVDRRNPEALTFVPAAPGAYEIGVSNELYFDLPEMPDFPQLPQYDVSGFIVDQPYHIEVWAEKSTMNDVLIPLCRRYGAVLQTGLGELSITASLAAVQRVIARGKPARIFYVSDFDPAGQSMPVAVARKIEFFIRSLSPDLDIQLTPVVLTPEQVEQFRLPRTPIKETELRAARFEERHGTGAVELDALEALYPGELESVLQLAIERYYDADLDRRAATVRNQLSTRLTDIRRAISDEHSGEIDDLKMEYADICDQFEEMTSGYNQRLTELWSKVEQKLNEAAPGASEYSIPQPRSAVEMHNVLFNSRRDYISQIEAYKAFQGKASMQKAA